MKTKYLLILITAISLKLINCQEEKPSLKIAGLLPDLQQVIIDYIGQDKWKLSKVLSGHTQKVNSVSISGDGSILVSGSDDQTVKIWDTKTGRCIKTLDFFEHKYFSNFDIRKIIADYADYKLSPSDKEFIYTDSKKISYVSVSNDTKYIAILNTGYLISIYDRIQDRYLMKDFNLEPDFSIVKDQTLEQVDEKQKETVSSMIDQNIKETFGLISFSQNNNFLIFTNNYQLLKLWDIKTARCLVTAYPNDLLKYMQNNEFEQNMYLGIVKKYIDIDNWNCELGICNYAAFNITTKTNTNLSAFFNLFERNKIRINYLYEKISLEKLKLIVNMMKKTKEDLSEEEKALNEDLLKKAEKENVYYRIEEKLPINSFAFSSNGKFLAYAVGNDIKIWNNEIQQLRSNN